jgi:hypothetical protein
VRTVIRAMVCMAVLSCCVRLFVRAVDGQFL